MKLPDYQDCAKDPFLHSMYELDKKQFLSAKWGTNQKFQSHRRIYGCLEILKKHLPPAPAQVADFACGTANMGLMLAQEGYQVDLVDNEPKFFDYIRLKKTNENVGFIQANISEYVGVKKYDAIFLGEAIEHMARPLEALKNLRDNLKPGGLLCLSTPNGGFVNCYEPNWEEVKHQTERNEKLANNIGNHVCEFTMNELKGLVKEAGLMVLEHHLILSHQMARSGLLRRVLPRNLLFSLDSKLSKRKTKDGKTWGIIQILLAQRVH